MTTEPGLFDDNPSDGSQPTVEQPTEPSEVLDQLVGEGKKFKTVEDLARGKAASDEHILRLERENKELREGQAQADKIDQLLKLIKERQAEERNRGPDDEPTTAHAPSLEDLSRLVREQVNQSISESRQKELAETNLMTAVNALTEVYGSDEKASQVLAQKARELGVSKSFLKDLASKSPKALLDLIGVQDKLGSSPSALPSSVPSEAISATSSKEPKPGTPEYYDHVLKTDKARYFSPEFQKKLWDDVKKDPERFLGSAQ